MEGVSTNVYEFDSVTIVLNRMDSMEVGTTGAKGAQAPLPFCRGALPLLKL